MTLCEEILSLTEWSAMAHGSRYETHDFPSSSTPGKTYRTIKYADGSMSCDCPGWTHAKGGNRTCKHVKQLGGKIVGA